MALAGLALLVAATAALSRLLRGVRLPVRRAAWPLAGLGGLGAAAAVGSSSLTVLGLAAAADAGAIPPTTAWAAVAGANVGATVLPHALTLHPPLWAVCLTAAAAVGACAVPRARTGGAAALALLAMSQGMHWLAAGVGGLAPAVLVARAARGGGPVAFGLGVALTATLFSSQIAIGVLQSLAQGGAVSLRAGIAFVCGANIGTTADVLLASLGCRRRGRATALFHLGFNLCAAGLGLALLGPLARWLAPAPPAAALARAHSALNLTVALAVGPLCRPLLRCLRWGQVPLTHDSR